ncbi:MAG: CobW family GTP-binding protein [Geitlerinemataceae cyanobacterium]
MTSVSEAPVMSAPKLGMPVTIVTGFLGSGKTTLLNHILLNQQGVKTAILVNEFGEIGIDNDLIVSTDESTIELSNGCICCTINSDLLDAVYKVLERDDKVDYLIVETTGVADPLPVALTFLGTELRDLTRLDSIVTLVDCENYSLDLFNSEAAYSQIAYGDIILLNKTDLVDEAKVDHLETRVRDIKSDARILRTTHSKTALPLILSVGLFESDKYFESEKSDRSHDHHDHSHDHSSSHDHSHDHDGGGEPGGTDETHNHSHAHGHHDHGHHDHDHHGHDHHDHSHSDHLTIDGFVSVSFQSDRPFDIRKFQYFLDNQLPENIFRSKGILWFEESPARHIFHLSGKRFTIEDDDWPAGATPSNQIVFIGQDLDRETLLGYIEHCLILETAGSDKGFD